MPRCETCGNDYDKAMSIQLAGASHTFDSFACATQKLAPTEKDGKTSRCMHCAHHA